MAGGQPREPVLLASDVPYSRMLLKQTLGQHGCDVTTANSVAEALKKLDSKPFKLLMIDLVNPESASEQLMLQVRVGGNNIAILMLCSGLDRDMLRRLSSLRPIGFLTKPLNVVSLVSILPLALAGHDDLLRRSIELARVKGGAEAAGAGGERRPKPSVMADEMVRDSQIDEDRLKWMFGAMPLLPHVVARILQISGDESTTVREISQVIGGDPRLTGQLLRIVNSAYFGFSRRIATIPEATVILGTQAIRNLIIGAAVSNFFGGKSKLLDRARLWRHSLACAIAARKVAERVSGLDGEEAFTAGLLHDFGRLALERHLADYYARALQKAREGGSALLAAEEQTLGMSHAWLSGWLARKWNLPSVLGEAMSWHHQPESAHEPCRAVAAAVNVGNVVCHMAELGGIEGVEPTLTASGYALGILSVGVNDMQALVPSVVGETNALEQQLSAALSAAS